jgi:hypothetical protein
MRILPSQYLIPPPPELSARSFDRPIAPAEPKDDYIYLVQTASSNID